MKPIYFRGDELAFTSNGLGRLNDCISCVVTEERNGIYECEFEYPITGRFYNDLLGGGIIGVIHDDQHDIQPFDIYKHSAPINGVVTFNAHHISYRQNSIILKPFTAPSLAATMAAIPLNSVNPNPFTYWTDKSVGTEFTLDRPENVKAVLQGQQGSILDVYGKGDYEFDKWTVRLYTNRGRDTGVTIRYGKNLSDVVMDKDRSGTYTAVAPYWSKDGVTVTLPEIYVLSPDAPTDAYPWTDENGEAMQDGSGNDIYFNAVRIAPVPIDFTNDFEEAPSFDELRQRALRYLANNQPWLPSENIKVDFVQLWQTPEYEDVASLQRVRLCDTVSVFYPELGVIAANEKVIKTVYNVLQERYDEIELGQVKTTLAQAISAELQGQITSVVGQMDIASKAFTQEAIDHATELISGGLGGYVVFNTNADGQPQEILIMDTDDINTAVNVIRMNRNGIGFSTTGYEGPYTSAWTIDGRFNADFIATGHLLANFIQGGTLSLGGTNNDNGVLAVYDSSGNLVGQWTKDGIVINNGAIAIPYTYDNGTGTTQIDADGFLVQYTYADRSKAKTVINNIIGMFSETAGGVRTSQSQLGPWYLYIENFSDGLSVNPVVRLTQQDHPQRGQQDRANYNPDCIVLDYYDGTTWVPVVRLGKKVGGFDHYLLGQARVEGSLSVVNLTIDDGLQSVTLTADELRRLKNLL